MEALKNGRQEQFCLEYIISLNATKAAVAAKYSEKTAGSMGSALLKKPHIQKRIEHLKQKRAIACNIDAQWVLNRLNEIDSLDIADILDDEGEPLPIPAWPKSWRTSISGIDVQRMLSAGNDPNALKGAVLKIKWPDKVKNLEMIGRHVNVRAWEKELVDSGAELADAFKDLANKLPV